MPQFRPSRNLAAAIALATIFSFISQLSAEQQPATETFSVSKTHNDAPFDYRMKLLVTREGFKVYRLTYPSPVSTPTEQNNTIPADFYLPDNIKPSDAKRPAVICLHILDGNMKVTDLACSTLALRGIPAVMFWLPYYGDRQLPNGWRQMADDPYMFLSALVQSIADTRRTIDLLASRPEVDPQKIGVAGFSLGSIIAASVAGADARLCRAGLFLSGGDLMYIVHHAAYTRALSKKIHSLPPQEQTELENKAKAVEPIEYAPKLRDRARDGRVLMINAADDEIIPRKCTERLAESLGIADRVTWMAGFKHETFLAVLPESTRKIADFFAQDMPPGIEAPRPKHNIVKTPGERVSRVLQQAVGMFSTEIKPGRQSSMDLEIVVDRKGQSPINSRLTFVHGADNKFSLTGSLPGLGAASVGQGKYPWAVVGDRQVLVGRKNPVENRNPLSFADDRHFMKLRLVSGFVGSVALVPGSLDQWADVAEEKADDGRQVVRLAAKHKKVGGSLLFAFQSDGVTPAEVSFDVAGMRGKVIVHGWRVDVPAEAAAFDPPAGLSQRAVDQADLYRSFSVIFNLAMTSLEP